MASLEKNKKAIENLIAKANGTTDENDTDLTGAVNRLISGYTKSKPKEISTEAEMNTLLTTAEVGSVYKYVGTTGTYEKGALYMIEVDK